MSQRVFLSVLVLAIVVLALAGWKVKGARWTVAAGRSRVATA